MNFTEWVVGAGTWFLLGALAFQIGKRIETDWHDPWVVNILKGFAAMLGGAFVLICALVAVNGLGHFVVYLLRP